MSGSSSGSGSGSGRKVPGPVPVTASSAARALHREDGVSAGARGAEPRRAVALSYDPANNDAPVVAAAGEGLVAEEIIRRAREAGVPVTEDPKLAAVLSQLDPGHMIPPELYTVVAEVLAYVYRLEERVNRRR
jgi:flagellar biosynthesis protein